MLYNINDMKKAEVDILAHIQAIDETNNLLNQIPRTSQQQFLLNYAAIHFINKGTIIPSLQKSLQIKSSSFSYIQLKLKYMRMCMLAKSNLENPDFHVLNTLVLWMQGLQKMSKSSPPKLTSAALLPHPEKLKFHYYQEFIVYLDYLAIDVQNLFKAKTNHWAAEDLLQLLTYALPRIHYNILLPAQFLGLQAKEQSKDKPKDILFRNSSIQYITRVKPYYRSLMKLLIKTVIDCQLKPTQMRSMIDLVCRYYLLFWDDSRQNAVELFATAFSKVSEAVRFSLTDQLLLFFKICQKLGAAAFLQALREKWQFVDSLLVKYGNNAVGHPKDQIYPYNPLEIRQKITVEAGKTSEKMLQIYSEYSLFYFSVEVQDLDINIRLYFLGDFDSNIEIKNVLLSEDKRSQLNKFAFMATKRGLYKIEIDNTYSWINSKKIEFQYVVLSQHSSQYPLWYNNLFEINNTNFRRQKQENHHQPKPEKKTQKPNTQVYQLIEKEAELHFTAYALEPEKRVENTVSQISTNQKYEQIEEKHEKEEEKNEKLVDSINKKQEIVEQRKNQTKQTNAQITLQNQNPNLQSKRSSQELIVIAKNLDGRYQFAGQANLSLIDNIFSLLVSTCDHTYEFQTNFQDRIVKRLKSYSESNEQYQWIVNGQARDWLKRHGFALQMKKGVSFLVASEGKQYFPGRKNEKVSYQ